MASKTYLWMRYDTVVVPAEAYNRRATFQQPIQVQDPVGGQQTTWQDLITTWVHMEAWTGREVFLDQQLLPQVWTRILMRYHPSINFTAIDRMVYGTRIFDIRGIWVPAEARIVVEMIAEELFATGTEH